MSAFGFQTDLAQSGRTSRQAAHRGRCAAAAEHAGRAAPGYGASALCHGPDPGDRGGAPDQTTKRDWAPRRPVCDAMPHDVRGGGDPRQACFARRLREWACRLGALPPMRMTASWFGSGWIHRIQGCGAMFRPWRAPLGSSPRSLGHAAAQSARTAGGYVDDRRRRPAPLPPASRASSKSGEMLAFAHIPTGPANKEN